MQLLSAIATSSPRQVNTRYGERMALDAQITSAEGLGQVVTIWRSANDSSLRSIVNGSRLQLGLDAKGRYSLVESPADRAANAQHPISPEISAPNARPMGFDVQLPMEAERALNAQLAAARQSGSAIDLPQGDEPMGIDVRIGQLGAIYSQCLAVAHGSEAVALAIFSKVVPNA